jgi:hypothetical protein
MEKLKLCVAQLSQLALEHVDLAKAAQPQVPSAGRAALLPATPIAHFLQRLEQQRFDLFEHGGLAQWRDGRPHALVLLQGRLLLHTVRNTYL